MEDMQDGSAEELQKDPAEELQESPAEELNKGQTEEPQESPKIGSTDCQETWKDLGEEEHQGLGELQEGPVGMVL